MRRIRDAIKNLFASQRQRDVGLRQLMHFKGVVTSRAVRLSRWSSCSLEGGGLLIESQDVPGRRVDLKSEMLPSSAKESHLYLDPAFQFPYVPPYSLRVPDPRKGNAQDLTGVQLHLEVAVGYGLRVVGVSYAKLLHGVVTSLPHGLRMLKALRTLAPLGLGQRPLGRVV